MSAYRPPMHDLVNADRRYRARNAAIEEQFLQFSVCDSSRIAIACFTEKRDYALTGVLLFPFADESFHGPIGVGIVDRRTIQLIPCVALDLSPLSRACVLPSAIV